MITNITIDVIMAVISDDYQPTDTELLILRDIVRDQKQLSRGNAKEFDSVSIMEIFDYKIKIDPDRLSKLSDKKRLEHKIPKDKFIKNYIIHNYCDCIVCQRKRRNGKFNK